MKNRIVFDLLFWTTIKLYEIVFYGSGGNDHTYALKTSLSRFPAELILYYAGMNLILPGYFANRKPKQLIVQLATALFFAILIYRIGRFWLFPNGRIEDNFWLTIFNVPQFLVAPFYFLPIPMIGFMIYIFKRLNQIQLQRKEAEKQKMIAEVNLLKSQVQPHFLFNTLNNLYSLALQSHQRTPGFILKLSSIMEYMLYKASKDLVSIGSEIQHLENYVELEKLRYGDRLEVSWDLDDQLFEVQIAPLLLFVYVENAFKHGASKDDESTWISISLKREGEKLVYTVVNSLPEQDKKAASASGGYGLKNLYNRLELSYAQRYELVQIKGDDSFLSTLRLEILQAL